MPPFVLSLFLLLAALFLAPAARADVTLDVVNFNQTTLNTADLRNYGCAATSLAMICNYYGSGKGLQQSVDLFIANNIVSTGGWVNTRSGLTAAVGGSAVMQHETKPANLTEIRAALDAGHLVEGYQDTPYTHHYVIVGYSGSTFLINDPGDGAKAEALHYNLHGCFIYSGTRPASEGSFVSYAGHVYRIAGGAPVYVSNWDAFGGPQPTVGLSDAQFGALRSVPADGTMISSTTLGHVYIIAGGAPLYISNWAAIGGERPSVGVDQWCIDNWNNPLAHLNNRPADGTVVSSTATGRVYVVAGGAPLYVSNWAAIGGEKPSVGIDQWCIDNWSNPLAHLNNRPADGTFLNTSTGSVYRVAGGAPIAVSSWSVFGGVQPYVTVDQWCLDNIGVPLVHLGAAPVDATVVEGLPSHSFWSFSSGFRSPAIVTIGAVQVDDAGLAAFSLPPAPPTITPIAPTATSSWPSGSAQTVAWRLSSPTAAGEFRVSLVNQTTNVWYVNKQVLPVAGESQYEARITAAVPAGRYKAAVYWRPLVGSGAWTATSKSAAFTVTPINVTLPNASTVWPTQATCTVAWNANPAMTGGEFRVSLVNTVSGTWYVNKSVAAVAGKTSYATAVNTLVPPGSYRAAVYWRSVPGTGAFTATCKSAPFTVATLAISEPSAASSWKRLTTQTVSWEVSPGLASGEFRVSLVSATNVWYVNKTVPVVPGQLPYATALYLDLPAGTYRAAVYWRPPGSTTWVLTKKSGSFVVGT